MPEITASISREYAAGDDLSLVFTVVNADGDLIDISSGYTAKFALAKRVNGTTVVGTELSPATASIAFSSASPFDGKFTVTIDKAITAPLAGTYYFETELQDSSADESTPCKGYFDFIPTLI